MIKKALTNKQDIEISKRKQQKVNYTPKFIYFRVLDGLRKLKIQNLLRKSMHIHMSIGKPNSEEIIQDRQIYFHVEK